MHAGGSGVRLFDGLDIKLLILIGVAGASCILLGPPDFNWCFSFAPGFSKLFGAHGQLTETVESSFLIHQGGYHDLFVFR